MNSMNLLRILATNEKSTPRVERYSHTANPKRSNLERHGCMAICNDSICNNLKLCGELTVNPICREISFTKDMTLIYPILTN